MHEMLAGSFFTSVLTLTLQTAVGGSGTGVGTGGGLLAGSSAGGFDVTTAFVAIVAGIVLIAVLFPIARAIARRMEHKGAGAATTDASTAARMERLEQSVEAMTLEIERISEGQRYTTKLLTERLPLAVKVPQPGQSDKTLL